MLLIEFHTPTTERVALHAELTGGVQCTPKVPGQCAVHTKMPGGVHSTPKCLRVCTAHQNAWDLCTAPYQKHATSTLYINKKYVHVNENYARSPLHIKQ